MGDGRAEGSSAKRGGQAVISLMPDVDGTGSGSLLDSTLIYPLDMSLSNPGVGDGQGSMESCRPWGHRESDTTE